MVQHSIVAEGVQFSLSLYHALYQRHIESISIIESKLTKHNLTYRYRY
jgi:hypothetical protein